MLSTLSLLSLVPFVLAHGNHNWGVPDTPAIRSAGIAHRQKYDAWVKERSEKALLKRDSTWETQAAITGAYILSE